MKFTDEIRQQLKNELKFSASRSSGPGGQNVNKVNTRVELRFPVLLSTILADEQKKILLQKLKNRMNSEGELLIFSDVERSQLRNKEKTITIFFQLIEKALTPAKKRLKTKPTASSKQKRLQNKKQHAQKKEWRKRPEL